MTGRNTISKTYPTLHLLRACLGLILIESSLPHGLATGLIWDVLQRQVSTTAGTESVAVKFTFVNSSTAPISITALDTGCVCTSAKASKASYAPSERGELDVEFVLGERVGRQERLLNVTTDEAGTSPQQLRLVVDIAEQISIHPRLLFWAVGDAIAEKSVTITLVRPAQTKLSAPMCSTADFTARVEATDRPEIFQLRLTPVKTTVPINAVVRLDAVIDGKKQIVSVFAAVR